jgi:hypothetical protein
LVGGNKYSVLFYSIKREIFFPTLPVGKAQETLGHIDQACRRLAALASGGGDAPIPLEQGRLLVRFLWHLEQAGSENIRVLKKNQPSVFFFFFVIYLTRRESF